MQVIHPLVQQRARNEFLTMAFELENRNHRDIHRLLVAAKQLLQDRVKEQGARMVDHSRIITTVYIEQTIILKHYSCKY